MTAQGLDAFAQGFEPAGVTDQSVELGRDRPFRKVGIDLLYDLIIIIPHTDELIVEIVQPGDILRFGGIVSRDAELSAEDARNDEVRFVPFAPGLGKHPQKADVLLGVQFEIVPVNLGTGLPGPSAFSVCHILDTFKSLRLRSIPDGLPEGGHFCMPKIFSAYKNTARYRHVTVKPPERAAGGASDRTVPAP